MQNIIDQTLTRQLRRKTERQLKKIKIIPSDVSLTATTGLGVFIEIFNQSPFALEFKNCLPERISHRSVGSYMMGLLMLAGHIRGVENVSSLRRVRTDPYLRELFENDVAAIRTIQDFLYDFGDEQMSTLQN